MRITLPFAFLALAHGGLFAAETKPAEPAAPAPESFETVIPAHVKAAGGRVSLSTISSRDGVSSLRWDFSDGDALELRPGPFGNANVFTGYGGYSRSALDFYLRLARTGPGKVVVELLSGDEVAGVIEVPLAYRQWQHIVYHYSWNTRISWKKAALKNKLDGLRLRAVGTAPGGALLLDSVHYNVPRDFRDGRDAITKPWTVPVHDFSKQAPPTPADIAAMDRLLAAITPAEDKSKPPAHWERQLASVRAAADKRHYRPGNALTGGLVPLLQLLNDIAGNWASCPVPELKAGFAKEFIAIQDWAQDQGLVTDGALGVANNYIGRYYVDAVSKIAPALAKAGKLDDALAYLKWSYAYDERLFGGDGTGGESMDYLHNEAFRLLRMTLMHGSAAERWHHLSRFRLVLSNQLVASVKPDGSLFHHGFHYFAYGTMGMGSISGALATLSAAGLPVEERALDAAGRGVMAMRWYAGGDGVLLSLCGRHPSGRQTLAADTFLNLAKAYRPYRDGKPDAELMGAYLRLSGKKDEAFNAEPAPQGFVAMPFAGLGLCRRDNWLAGVKGYGRDIAAGESYANANRFGLYLSNGFLELLTHPEPLPNVTGSGCHPDEGWNWCALDGTTTIHAPLAKIANGNGTQSERSDRTFVGGLSHAGGLGVFAADIRSGLQADRARGRGGEPFVARKSYFFLGGNRILCLGSGIAVKDTPFPVRTTLFQKFLTADFPFALAGGDLLKKPESGGPLVRELPANTLLRDPYGNAYLSREPVRLSVGEQKSRNGYDTADSAGDYATAWIDHGENPAGAGYEYLVAVRATDADMASLKKGETGVRVLRRDADAHVVRADSGLFGYAVFDAKSDLASLPGSPVVAADGPLLAMAQPSAAGLALSFTHPAPRLGETKPVAVGLRLAGRFALEGAPRPGVTVLASGGETRVTAEVLHGESVSLRLHRLPPEAP